MYFPVDNLYRQEYSQIIDRVTWNGSCKYNYEAAKVYICIYRFCFHFYPEGGFGMKRKLISAVLCASMVGSLMLGAVPAFAEDDDIKIGVSIWSSTDVLGSQCKWVLDEAAKALGVELQYVDQGHVPERVTGSVETLCAADCDGIIICNSTDTEMLSAIQTCNDNGVYLAQFFRIINEETNPDIYALATASPY